MTEKTHRRPDAAPGHLAHRRRGVVHERDRPERGADGVEGGVGERQRERVGLHQRHAYPGPVGGLGGVPQHAGGEVQRDRSGALRGQPAGGGGRAGAEFEDPPAGDVAEQPRVGLAQPLRAPDEVRLAEERAVLGLVGVGVGVPPAPVGAADLGGVDPPAGHPVVVHPSTLGRTGAPDPVGVGVLRVGQV